MLYADERVRDDDKEGRRACESDGDSRRDLSGTLSPEGAPCTTFCSPKLVSSGARFVAKVWRMCGSCRGAAVRVSSLRQLRLSVRSFYHRTPTTMSALFRSMLSPIASALSATARPTSSLRSGTNSLQSIGSREFCFGCGQLECTLLIRMCLSDSMAAASAYSDEERWWFE